MPGMHVLDARRSNFKGSCPVYKFMSENNHYRTRDNVHFGENVKKVVLIEPGKMIGPGSVINVSGWASQNLPQKIAYQLLSTQMVILNTRDCIDIYNNLITPSNFCVKYQAHSRLSDIGGPATYKSRLVGIVSYSISDDHKQHVAILTNVSYFHKWITLNTKRFLEKYCVPYEMNDESN